MRSPIHIIEAPSSLGLRPPAVGVVPGTRLAPAALRAAGLRDAIGAVSWTSLAEPPYSPELDKETGVRNLPRLVNFTHLLAETIGIAVDAGTFPFVVGGDCSVLLGAALALRRRGRYGLIFIDGHSDFANPDNSPRYPNAAGMDLALATGRGPSPLTNIDGLRPYFREQDTTFVGGKDLGGPGDPFGADLHAAGIHTVTLSELTAGAEALERISHRLVNADVLGFWLHLDVDILLPERMPAVDSPDPGGLTWEELARVLDAILGLPQVVGMELTIFDPTLDPAGELARQLATFLSERFQRRSGQVSARASTWQ